MENETPAAVVAALIAANHAAASQTNNIGRLPYHCGSHEFKSWSYQRLHAANHQEVHWMLVKAYPEASKIGYDPGYVPEPAPPPGCAELGNRGMIAGSRDDRGMEVFGELQGFRYLAIDTGIWTHWSGWFTEKEALEARQRSNEFKRERKQEPETGPLEIERGTPGEPAEMGTMEGPWIVVGRPGEKVTVDDISRAFLALKEKYPDPEWDGRNRSVWSPLYQLGRGYGFAGVDCAFESFFERRPTHVTLPHASHLGGRERMVKVPCERCFEIGWDS